MFSSNPQTLTANRVVSPAARASRTMTDAELVVPPIQAKSAPNALTAATWDRASSAASATI